MASKRPNLAETLAKAANPTVGPAAAPVPRPAPTVDLDSAATLPETAQPIGARTSRADRNGRINITGYFDPAVKASLRLIQSRHPHLTQQDLLAEALNDLFAKYNIAETAKL